MRIISDFYDYYDSAQAFGQDQSVIYQRKTMEFKKNFPSVIIELQKRIHQKQCDELGKYFNLYLISSDLSLFHIVFCGKIYNVAYSHNKFFYSSEKLFQYLNENKSCITDNKMRTIAKWFNISYDVKNFCIENKIICLKLGKYVSINPELKQFQFYQVIDSFTAYQELDMYISGTLSFPQNALIEIEDKYRIKQYGFDKYSFRKLPTKE